jgi:hypothetical protein
MGRRPDEVDFGWWALPGGTSARVTWDRDVGVLYVWHALLGRTTSITGVRGRGDVDVLLAGLDPFRPGDIVELEARAS